MARVYEGKPCGLDRWLGWCERGIYRLAGVDPAAGDGVADVRRRRAAVQRCWAFRPFICCCDCRARCRSIRKDLPATTPDLAFNTAASFATNTNWQSYGGETTLSYLSQMLGPDGAELRLGGDRHGGAGRADSRPGAALGATIGNFWFDLVRSTLYILLPLSMVVALRAGVAGRDSELQAVRDGERRSKPSPAPTGRVDRRKRSRWARPLRRSRSSNSAPTAAGSSTSTRRIRSRIPTPLANFLEVLAILLIPAGACVTRSA